MSNNLNIVIGFQGKDHLSQPVTKLQTKVKNLTEEFQQAQSKLKALNALQGKINNFKKLTDAIKKQGESINKTTDKLTAQNKKLKELHDKRAERLADIKKLRKDIGMAKDPMEYSKLNAALTKAHILYEKTRNDVREHNKKIKEQESTLKKLRHEKAQNIIESRSLNRVLKESGVNVKKLEHHESELAAKTMAANRAVDKQKQSLAAANQKLAKYNHYLARQKHLTEKADSAKNFGMKALGSSVSGGFLTARFLGAGVDFEKSMSKVEALTRIDKSTKQGLAQLNALKSQAKFLGGTTKFTAGEVADAQGYLAMAGYTVEQIKAALPSVLNAAIASGFDVSEVSDIASDISGGFKIPAKEMSRVADVLTYATTTANVDLRTMYETMKEGAPVMTSLGQSIETTAAMAGMLGNVGIKGSAAGTAIKNIGLNMIDNKHLKKLKIKVKDAKGNMRQIPEILRELKEKTASMGDADRASVLNSIFGKIPIAAAMELMSQADGKLQKYEKDLRNAKGTASKVAKIMSENMDGDLKNLGSAWEGLEVEIFEQFKDTLRSIVQWITKGIRQLTAFTAEHKTLTKVIGSLLAIGGVLLGIIGALAMAYSFVLSPIFKVVTFFKFWSTTGTQAAKSTSLFSRILPKLGKGLLVLGNVLKQSAIAVARFGLAFMATPLGMIITVIAAVVGAIYLLWNKCDWFRNGIISLWNGIKNFFGGIWDSITSLATGGIGNFITTIASAFNPFAIIYNAFAKVINWLGGDLPATLAELGAKLFDGMAEGIKNAISGIGDSISSGVNSAIDAVSGWFGGDNKTTTKVEAAKKIVKKSEVNSNIIAKKPNVTIDKRTPIRAKQKHQTVNAPMTNNLTINVENGDPKAIKQIVLQTFQELQLKQQAQARAALVDQY